MKLEEAINAFADIIAEKVAHRVKNLIPPPKKLMTAKEAGEYIGRSPHAVYALVARGEIPAVRVGRRTHVAVKDLDVWIESNKV
jgi:excisionase family DNA binding protein